MNKLVELSFLTWVFCFGLGKSTEVCKTCTTQTCSTVADQIKGFMDRTKDPCEDFNQYACGGFLKTSFVNSGPFQDGPIQLKKDVERLIKINKPRDKDFDVDQKVRDFYRACEKFSSTLKENRVSGVSQENVKGKQLAQEIKKSLRKLGLDAWPYSSNSIELKDFRWYDIVPKMIKEGLVYTDGRIELPIINVDVGVNDLTHNESILKIDSPDFDDKVGKSDEDYYTRIHFDKPKLLLQIMNPGNIPLNQIVLNRSLEIDEALRNISTSSDRHQKHVRDYGYGWIYSYKQTTLSALPSLPCGTMPSDCTPMTWNTFIDSLFKASGNPNVKTRTDQKVLVKDTKYFRILNKKLKELKIPAYEMANYIGWKVLVDYLIGAENLNNAFRGDCINYLIRGYDRRDYTTAYTEQGLLNIAVGSMYVREYFDIKKKEDALTMIKDIRETFRLLVPKLDWMDEKTKKNTIEKLDAMGQFVGYPDELLNKNLLDNYYQGLQFSY